ETRKFISSLTGRLNLFNLAAILAVFQEAGFSWEQISPFTSSLQPVPGRLERIREITDRRIYLDYAHSPDALDKVLSDLRLLKPQRIICLFGAGGNRDKGKRPGMLKSVLSNADLAIITNDNPRKEDPSAIIDDLVSSTHGSSRFWIIRDRKTAIQTAFRITRPEDILLIAGKGHETYQEIGSEKIPFSDKEQILLAAKMEFPSDRLVLPVDPLQLKYISSAEIINSTALSAFYVSTDSRKIKDNSIFFALQGENFNGHNYVSEVLNKNNCLAVVAKNYLPEHPNLIKFDDPLKTLGDLAASYRNMFSTRLIAITGSVGKTTTKEYLANILAIKSRVLKTHANENNLIGVPKTLFNLRTDHDYAVLELGSNHFGEIARLSTICKPEIALITQIGASHLEFLEDLDGVFREKTQIFSSEPQIRFVPGDEPRFNDFNAIKVGYDNTNDYQITKVATVNGATCFELNGDTFSITSPFRQFVINAAFAAAVAIELDIDPDMIRQGLSKSLETSMRMEIKMSGNRIILADCYNANPDSMLAAINFWQEYESGRPHLAILGDMLELGKLTEKLHRKIWTRLKECNYERLIAVGNYAGFYGAKETFPDIQALIDSGIWKEFPADAVILLKASHALNLEKILERI
ncbi:MAG: UDP-N-acetylmuramoyl-tripeptide--D-alanyl-D-alanine ligase, partial [Candidatus Cloacimonetes bacterium]|nr:UDP-N-acetylmuramoyl-tripeptide--D-alanyl-D-alanine ligase [Candidatus Cloacimonadota bacterium]